MAKRGWSKPFEDPIVQPDGRKLVTLKNAADYIMKLPKAEARKMADRDQLPNHGGRRSWTDHARADRGASGAASERRARVYRPQKDRHWGSGSWREIGDPRQPATPM